MIRIGRFLAAVCFLALVGAACGDDDDGGDGSSPTGDPAANLLANPGFEEGQEAWQSRSRPAVISSDQHFSGDTSGWVSLDATEDSGPNEAEWLVQDITTDAIPERLSLNYFVDEWVRATDKQYIEVAITVIGGVRGMPICPGGPCPNIQVRYVLAGVTAPPGDILNAQWIFSGDTDPVLGEWTAFEANVLDDFRSLWDTLPEEIETVRIQFEARFDDRELDELPLQVDVYVDDLYLGPE
jgi:hypothetical protein